MEERRAWGRKPGHLLDLVALGNRTYPFRMTRVLEEINWNHSKSVGGISVIQLCASSVHQYLVLVPSTMIMFGAVLEAF